MGNRILAYFVLLSSFSAFAAAHASAQLHEPNAFLKALSFDWTGGSIYNSYHGYAAGGRFGIAAVNAPMVNRIFSKRPEASADLLILPGMKIGSVNAIEAGANFAVQIAAPELSIHYPVLKIFRLLLYGGPAVEFTFTNNSRQYLLVPSVGIDAGAQYTVTQHFAVALENRWITTSKGGTILNQANFPRERYAYVSVVLHFSLPWQTEEKVSEEVRADYEKRISAYAATDGDLKKKILENDSLTLANSELKKDITIRAAIPAREQPAPASAVESYDPAHRAGDPEYLFTKDPFKGGSLVNDAYLKNVLIDIIDEEYVWQISAKPSRIGDAEKIKNFFSAYNGNLGGRMVIVPDENVRTFKLRCLGKVVSAKIGTKRK
jgi:hypothetical protein